MSDNGLERQLDLSKLSTADKNQILEEVRFCNKYLCLSPVLTESYKAHDTHETSSASDWDEKHALEVRMSLPIRKPPP